MKNFIFLFWFSAISIVANCQEIAPVKATISGYKSRDTIRIDDFMKFSEISLNNKNYSILNFTLLYSDSGFDHEIDSYSNKITDEMKNAISALKNNEEKIRYIVFRNITVQMPPNNKLKIEDLILGLKMK